MVLTGTSKMTLSIPRDRAGTFDPKLIAKCQRRRLRRQGHLHVCARDERARDPRACEELYGIDVSPDLISAVTDAILEEVAKWQNRPPDAVYPLVFFDAIRVKIRDEGFVRNKAVYMNELKNRGVGDILIAVVDGLKGFLEAISAVFPQTVVQTCIVHLIHHSLEFVRPRPPTRSACGQFGIRCAWADPPAKSRSGRCRPRRSFQTGVST
ncbi:transposase [Mesorhizobium sp. M0854]|uniref:transposase n=1 Tax=Mesorhizobium sp. M0854 TaxID=2957013 RepID=UPI00333BF354